MLQSHRVVWSLSHLSMGEEQGSPRTGHQSIAGLTQRGKQPLTAITPMFFEEPGETPQAWVEVSTLLAGEERRLEMRRVPSALDV